MAPTLLQPVQSAGYLRKRIAVTNSAGPGNAPQAVFSSGTQQTMRKSYQTVASAASGFRMYFPNWAAGLDGDRAITNAVTFKAAIEYAGTTYPAYAPDLSTRSITMAPGDGFEMYVPTLTTPPSAAIFARVWVDVGVNTNRFSGSSYGADVGDSFTVGSDVVDGTGDLVNVANSAANWGFLLPVTITADLASRVPQVVVLGDSIALGTEDAPLNRGYIRHALGTSFAVLDMAANSEQAAEFMTVQHHQYRAKFITGADYVIDDYGFNDLYFQASPTLAGWQAARLAVGTLAARRGAKVYVTTTTPYASFSGAKETIRVNGNTWLRAGAPIDQTTRAAVAVGTPSALVTGDAGHPWQGVADAALLAETSLNSGVWNTGYSTDGIHPNSTGVPAISSAINTAVLV